ncbi:hypothetical protein [Granulicatella elegans]|uniref:hypothetical protein n=1 Tax=Granulicatella elegans TaxID=137732 RepID=UPI001D142DA9|nr:hypothetical protein [Granulicatella elegans]UEA32102.1 hypothetical protein LK443_04000 [Granulicatella elegans]
MKISEGDFIFELKFLTIHPQTHNIQTDVFLQVSHQEQAYQELIDLLSVAQLEECLVSMKNLLEKGEEYSSEFEQSRLAVLLEKLEEEYVMTWVIAPENILTTASQVIGIDLAQLDEEAVFLYQEEEEKKQTKTVEVELSLSAEEMRQIYEQLQEDLKRVKEFMLY